jgi:hypothetical protein
MKNVYTFILFESTAFNVWSRFSLNSNLKPSDTNPTAAEGSGERHKSGLSAAGKSASDIPNYIEKRDLGNGITGIFLILWHRQMASVPAYFGGISKKSVYSCFVGVWRESVGSIRSGAEFKFKNASAMTWSVSSITFFIRLSNSLR